MKFNIEPNTSTLDGTILNTVPLSFASGGGGIAGAAVAIAPHNPIAFAGDGGVASPAHGSFVKLGSADINIMGQRALIGFSQIQMQGFPAGYFGIASVDFESVITFNAEVPGGVQYANCIFTVGADAGIISLTAMLSEINSAGLTPGLNTVNLWFRNRSMQVDVLGVITPIDVKPINWKVTALEFDYA